MNAAAAYGPAQYFDDERDPPVNSGFGFRVTLVGYHDNRVLNMESNLEANVGMVLDARNDVKQRRTQWPTVKFFDEDGVAHFHTFDFYVEIVNGLRYAIAVRPEDQAEELHRMIALMKRQDCEIWSIVDDVIVLTEVDTEFGQAANARRILRARRNRNSNEVETLRALLESSWGIFRFHDLLAGLEVPAHRRNAIWCLIDEGFLAPVAEGRITDRSYLCVAANLADAA